MQRWTFSAILVSSLLIGVAQADTLLVDRVERSATAALPTRGSTMDQVEAQFGAPAQKIDAVGQPPISRWVYAGFTVYFEHSHVIHSVVNKSTAQEKGPKPADTPAG